jgi:hypothetical protein
LITWIIFREECKCITAQKPNEGCNEAVRNSGSDTGMNAIKLVSAIPQTRLQSLGLNFNETSHDRFLPHLFQIHRS